ncbi:MAG TPA: toxin TcdB middle/N-terminal domain-containing protein, partial [Kofleriaceae bacterium]|nr:toxin TcdB middle/N-terminal domain-containing protein [Kofleriaceae bacterium]
GASRLVAITATAFPPGAPEAPEHTRVLTLGYSAADEGCALQHAPIRLLTSIQESAWGIDAPRVDLPAVTFEYGDATANLVSQPAPAPSTPWPAGTEPFLHRNSLSWGYRYQDDRWPSVEAMMLDIDGDGLLDRVTNASTPTVDGQCRMAWKRNLGPAPGSSEPRFSGTEQYVPLPRLKWNGTGSSSPTIPSAGAVTADPARPHLEGCALNRQVTAYRNSYSVTGACHDGSACVSSGDPGEPGPYCYPGGTECPPGAGGGPTHGEYRTYLAYRWLDMDADGLVDLVAAVHGDIDAYDVVQGNALDQGAPRAPEPWLFGDWPACPRMDRCRQVDESCLAGARTCSPGELCTIDWAVVNACAASAPTRGCAGLIDDTGPIAIPPGGGTPNVGVSQAPYTRCEGLYPWFIYKNHGNGVFATTPIIKYQPIPLESDQGDSALSGPGLAATNHAVIDFDGDGVLDAIARPRGSLASAPPTWSVWLGDRSGGFGARRYTFFTRNPPQNAIRGIGLSAAQWAKSSNGLVDINGDGLLDHFRTSDDPLLGHANVAINDGTSFRLFGAFYLFGALAPFGDPIGEIETPRGASPSLGEFGTPYSTYAVKPGDDAVVTNAIVPSPPFPPVITTGETAASNRVIDVDHDGRVDVVQLGGAGASKPQVYFNVGGQFIAPGVDYPGASLDGLRRTTKMLDDVPGQYPPTLSWELTADLIDLDGDGLPESASFATGALVRVERPATAAPPRLLEAIHNGRGGHTHVTYASMHDSSAVEQHPEQTWFDGRPKASPQTQWVVKSVTAHDDVPHLDATTSYFYKNPRHGADDEGRDSFRGFEEVTATSPSGARTIQRYAYAPDWSGRLAVTLVVPAEAPAEVRSMTRTTWEERSLFGGAIQTYHPTVSERFTCANGQTEATCTAQTAPGYTRTTSTWTALASTTGAGPPLLWQVTGELVQAASAASDGDREAVHTFALDADGATYRLRPLTTTRSYRDGGAMRMYGKAAKTWDPTYRVALTDEVWLDADDANRAVARSVYDMDTGNVLEHWKPEQNAANSTHASFTYDRRKLFAVGEVNELGHRRDFVFDYGTGARVQTDGPNVRSCTRSCPSDALHPIREQHRVKIDGLGRPLEQWETIGDPGDLYTLVLVGTTSYVDLVTASAPTSVTSRHRIEHDGTTWTEETTELDGHGRPIRKTVAAQGSAPADPITTFVYRRDGTLEAASVPDPTANDARTVRYTYAFDSLGRPISIRRPDAASPVAQSGVDIAYDGMTKTTTEVVGAAGGSVGVTRAVHDKLGRLIEVQEAIQAAPLAWATTTYTYGPDDAVASVVDPEGVTTLLTHDFAGHRTRITRHGRTWTYTYDRNDNLIAEQAPGSPNPPFTDLNYTTTIAYDDLDRPVSKVIGPRDLATSDQDQFGSRTEVFTWDGCCNGTGRLTSWQSFGPSTKTPTSVHQFSYDAQGNRTGARHTFSAAGYRNLQHRFDRYANLLGDPTSVEYHDSVEGTNETRSRTYYDARGLPSRMDLIRTGQPTESIAVQRRNVAGLVTRRRTEIAGGPMPFVESLWTYDPLGRITRQLVRKGPVPTQIVRQDLTYFGNDDPRTLTHSLGTTSQRLDFGFDLRHQLAKVVSTTAGYFSASYVYGAGGRFTRVMHAQTISPLPPGTEVQPRDVRYVYGGADPEQITALTHVGSGTTYASYTYDPAGNQLTRAYPATGESWDYVYDGSDRLRRATKKLNGVVQGSEEYWYDGEGQRIAVLKRDASGAKTELIYFLGD